MRSSTRSRTGTNLSVQVGGLLLLISVGACEPMERTAVAVDCSAEQSVDYYPLPEAETSNFQLKHFGYAWEAAREENSFWGDADPTVNGYPTTRPFPLSGFILPQIKPIEGGGFCQDGVAAGTRHQYALHLQAIDHTFWGGLYTSWNSYVFGASINVPPKYDDDGKPSDSETGNPADGIAFWARREIESDANIIIYIEDDFATDLTSDALSRKPSVICIPADATSSTSGNVTLTTSADPNVQSSASAVPVVSDPRACGNRWRADLELSENWTFVKVPFSAFYKENVQPNKGTGVFDPTTKIRRFTFQYKGGQVISMWFDEVGLYREK